MPANRPVNRVPFSGLRAAVFLALALAGLPALATAQTRPSPANRELRDQTSAGFAKLRPLVDARRYEDARALVRDLRLAAPPDSYDAYLLSQIEAQILLTSGRLAAAIEPLERSLALGDRNPALREPDSLPEQLRLLAQLHYQAASEHDAPAARRPGYLRCLELGSRWLEASAVPSAEMRLLLASTDYALATLDPAQPETPRLRAALRHLDEAELLLAKPTAPSLLLLAACHLQLGDNLAAAEQLERLVARDPGSASTWGQLVSIYLGAAAATPDTSAALNLHLRALHTLDRAQAAGHLRTPRDNYTRVAILFNLQHYAAAADLLEAGLADGSLEDSRRNWELLVSACQQARQNDRARTAFARAAVRFPEDGSLEFAFAQFLYSAGDLPAAYARGQSAYSRPRLENPGRVALTLAFIAYESQRYAEAETWLARARSAGEPPDSLAPLSRAISEALRNRPAAPNAGDAPAPTP